MLWKDLIKIVQEKGLEEKPVNAFLSIKGEDGAQDANGSVLSYLKLHNNGELECILDDLKINQDTGCQMHPRTSPQAFENADEENGVFIQNAEVYGPRG